jgi:hypothetical protein
MALNPVPQPSQSLAQTQSPILNNFALIDAGFSQDHVDFNIPNAGKHNQVTLPVQAAMPVASANDDIIYAMIPQAPYPLTLINETFIHKQVAGVNQSVDIPFTASILSTNANPGNATNGWSYLPSGILIKWGSITGVFLNQVWYPYLFPAGTNVPAFTQLFNVTLQAVSQDVIPATAQTFNFLSVNSATVLPTGFSWTPHSIPFGNNQLQIFYFAIGK